MFIQQIISQQKHWGKETQTKALQTAGVPLAQVGKCR